MKFYIIAMMVFLVSLSVAFLNTLDVMNQDQYYGSGPVNQEWLDAVQSEGYKDQTFESSPVQNDQQTDFNSLSEFRIAMSILGTTLKYATYGFAGMLKSFGMPGVLAVLFAIPVWLIYFIFIAQIILRFTLEGR